MTFSTEKIRRRADNDNTRPQSDTCNQTCCQTRRNAIGEMSACDPGGAKQGCSLALHYEIKCGGKITVWSDVIIRFGIGFLLLFKLFGCDQEWPAKKMIIRCRWISGTQCTTESWILLAPAADQITCFALLNHVPTFFPVYSPGLLPVMAVSVLVINGVTHLKVVV